jgi:acyl carrier protein
MSSTSLGEGDSTVEQQIRAIVAEHARLNADVAQLDSQASLYQAGLTSHASVNLMLALEDHFEIEFPERMLRRRTFENIAAIKSAIEELTGGSASAA